MPSGTECENYKDIPANLERKLAAAFMLGTNHRGGVACEERGGVDNGCAAAASQPPRVMSHVAHIPGHVGTTKG